MITLRLFRTILKGWKNFDFSSFDFRFQPLGCCFGVDFVLFLIDHGHQFLFCLLNFVKALESTVKVEFVHLLIFERNFDLIDNIANFIHTQNRITNFTLVQVDFYQIMDVLKFVLGSFVIFELKDGNYLFDEICCESFLHSTVLSRPANCEKSTCDFECRLKI